MRRREFILNVVILALIVLSGIFTLFALSQLIIKGEDYKGVSPGNFSLIFFFFIVLYLLSRAGLFVLVSYVFVLTFLSLITYTAYNWGVELPQALVSFSLIIVMSGVLVGTRFAFIITGLSASILILLSHLRLSGLIHPQLYWKSEVFKMNDAVEFSITLAVIAIISWLSNREIERSLRRARRSEVQLAKERDDLEITVKKRTEELKRAQLEKLRQLYHFAEFGRLSSGLFHDLSNYLAALFLNIESGSNDQDFNYDPEKKMKNMHSIMAKTERFMDAVRKQLGKQDSPVSFSLSHEIGQVLEIFSYRSKKEKIKLNFICEKDARIFGNVLGLHQIVSNLLSNALDSYKLVKNEKDCRREVEVRIFHLGGKICISVRDWGCGISDEAKENIFKPFFTTKKSDEGIGIGLSSTREIVEKSFKGSIRVESRKDFGSTFVVEIPYGNSGLASSNPASLVDHAQIHK